MGLIGVFATLLFSNFVLLIYCFPRFYSPVNLIKIVNKVGFWKKGLSNFLETYIDLFAISGFYLR